MFVCHLRITTMKHAIIIGAGVSGLAAAIRLRHRGLRVTVFESRSEAGGKLYRFETGGYHFDGGPSLFTMPQYVDELFQLVGKNPRKYFNYQKSEEACRYFWNDQTKITAFSDVNAFANEVERVLEVPAHTTTEYFDHVRNIYAHSGKIFLEKSLHKAATWLSAETLRALAKISRYDLHRTMHRANKIRLKEPHLVQLFDRFATYNGSDPYRAPGILNVIPWLEHGFGTFFPNGGMISIAKALHKLAADMGVDFRFEQKVERILIQNGRAAAVQVNSERFDADFVISNMDVFYTYRKLMPEERAPERILKQERSSSAIVFYWGIKKEFPQLGLHNIFFSEDYKKEFQKIFESREVAKDVTVYVHVSSKMNSEDAPAGHENWFVMINTPSHTGQDWQNIEHAVRSKTIAKLSKILGEDVSELITVERTWNPKGIEADTMSYQGALYGNSSNNAMAAFLRHPNHSNRIKGLYFCGGSVHPGGGIPLALLSAKITSEIMDMT